VHTQSGVPQPRVMKEKENGTLQGRYINSAGTRTFAYNATFDLTSEAINGIYNEGARLEYWNQHWTRYRKGQPFDGKKLTCRTHPRISST
jgi:hypothetical protein